MIYLPTIVGVAVLVGLATFFWRRYGPGSGHAFGRKVAAHIGIPAKVFFALLDNGVRDSSRDMLASLERSTPSLEAAGIALAPVLGRGIERLESRFGRQEMYEQAKPIIARLVAASGAARADVPSLAHDQGTTSAGVRP